jgi:hypothetical protein
MLPDLRIVIATVLSTFVLSAGVGFYASSRLIGESKKGADSIASFEETPVNRIALSWPEPTKQPVPLALDFAVTAKALRNPIRDVTSEQPAAAVPDQPVKTAATNSAAPSADKPTIAPQVQTEVIPAPAEASPMPAPVSKAVAAPEPDIRVAVQYPPILELPEELRAPPAPVASEARSVPTLSDAPITTGSVPEQPKADEPTTPAVSQPATPSQPDTRVASRPEPDEAGPASDRAAEMIPLPIPAPRIVVKKPAPKKAAPRKTVKRAVRRTPPPVPTVPNFFSFFTIPQQQP